MLYADLHESIEFWKTSVNNNISFFIYNNVNSFELVILFFTTNACVYIIPSKSSLPNFNGS